MLIQFAILHFGDHFIFLYKLKKMGKDNSTLPFEVTYSASPRQKSRMKKSSHISESGECQGHYLRSEN